MPQPKKCPYCPSVFSMTGHLNRHILSHTAERPHACPYSSCGKTYSRADNLRQHIISAHEPTLRSYQCPHESCGKMFATKQHLNDHIALHDRPHPFKCTECGEAFRKRNQLAIHMSSHTGKLPYVCPEDGCGKEFLRPSALRKHSRVHNLGEKRFVCYCNAPDAAFAKFSQLQKHVKEKHPAPPKECEDCGKRFRTIAALERHYETHKEGGPERKHWCQVAGCNAGYVYRKGLTAHIRAKHTNVRRFSCEVCSFQTSYKVVLKKHMIKIHNMEHRGGENQEQRVQRDIDGANSTEKACNALKESADLVFKRKEREHQEQRVPRDVDGANSTTKVCNAQKESADLVYKRRRRRQIDFAEENLEESEDSEDGWSIRDTESEADNDSEEEESETDSLAYCDAEQNRPRPWPIPRKNPSKVRTDTGNDEKQDESGLKVSAGDFCPRSNLPRKRTLAASEDGDQQPRKRPLKSKDGCDPVGDQHATSMPAMCAADSARAHDPGVSFGDSNYFQSERAERPVENTSLLGSLFGVDETVESCKPSTSVAIGEESTDLTSGFRAVTGPVSSFITSG